jgi:hypothetical protein
MVSESVTLGGGANKSAPKPMMAQRSVMRREKSKDDKSPTDKEERDEDAPTNPDTPINLRSNFNALAIFAPSVKTDSNGKATVEVKVPDNLTRYRVMAVSVDTGKRFGGGESRFRLIPENASAAANQA